MVDVITSIVINVSLKIVRNYACDLDNAPSWYTNIKSVSWQTRKPLQVGSRIPYIAQFLGKDLIYTYEVVEYSDHKFVMKTAEGPFPMETMYSFAEKGSGSTVMSLRNSGNPSGFSKFFAPFMSMMIRRDNRKDLRAIKRILENN